MGGEFDITGESRQEVYQEYVEWIEEHSDMTPDLGAPDPQDEDECMAAMERTTGGAWLLHFHAHT